MGCSTSKTKAITVKPATDDAGADASQYPEQAPSSGQVVASAETAKAKSDSQSSSKAPWRFPLLMEKRKTKTRQKLQKQGTSAWQEQSDRSEFSLQSTVSSGQSSLVIPGNSTLEKIRVSATNSNSVDSSLRKKRRKWLSRSRQKSSSSSSREESTTDAKLIRSLVFPSLKSIDVLKTTPPTRGWKMQMEEAFWKDKLQVVRKYKAMERIDTHTRKVVLIVLLTKPNKQRLHFRSHPRSNENPRSWSST